MKFLFRRGGVCPPLQTQNLSRRAAKRDAEGVVPYKTAKYRAIWHRKCKIQNAKCKIVAFTLRGRGTALRWMRCSCRYVLSHSICCHLCQLDISLRDSICLLRKQYSPRRITQINMSCINLKRCYY